SPAREEHPMRKMVPFLVIGAAFGVVAFVGCGSKETPTPIPTSGAGGGGGTTPSSTEGSGTWSPGSGGSSSSAGGAGGGSGGAPSCMGLLKQDTCGMCLEGNCCQEIMDCIGDAACKPCLQMATAACNQNVAFGAFNQCVATSCGRGKCAEDKCNPVN